MVQQKKMDFWISKNLNVLFIGKHGVGKTSMVVDAFKRNKLKYLYFSGSTMDPFIDFCGVPLQTKNEKGETVIDLILPKHIDSENVEAIFIDEYNRSAKKIRNATMELIQFKSINGRPFPNLKVIWAAINPDEEEESDNSYDVEALDPAQKDRFQVWVDIPYQCDKEYFSNKFGESNATAAIEWWSQLNNQQKNSISPRRLDYALTHHLNGGELKDILPKSANITLLSNLLLNGSIVKNMDEIMAKADIEKAKVLISNLSIQDLVEKTIEKNLVKFGAFFIPLMPEEQLIKFVSRNLKNKTLSKIIVDFIRLNNVESTLYKVAVNTIHSKSNKSIASYFSKIIKESNVKISLTKEAKFEIEKMMANALNSNVMSNTYNRNKHLEEILSIDNSVLTQQQILEKLKTIDIIISRYHNNTLRNTYHWQKSKSITMEDYAKKNIESSIKIFLDNGGTKEEFFEAMKKASLHKEYGKNNGINRIISVGQFFK